MKRTIVILLLIVVALASVNYAAAEDIDLSTMTRLELENLRTRINRELKNRPEEDVPKDEKERRRLIERKYDSWVEAYDFDSILADIDSGKSGLTDECASYVRELAAEAVELLKQCINQTDLFTGEFQISFAALSSFGDGCRVYPYLDNDGMSLLAGFPYDDSLHYDSIFIRYSDGQIDEKEKFSDGHEYDIQFEKFAGDRWEYSLLDGIYLSDGVTIDAVSFRENGSVRKVDYELSDMEKAAVSVLGRIDELGMKISIRITHWNLYGE